MNPLALLLLLLLLALALTLLLCFIPRLPPRREQEQEQEQEQKQEAPAALINTQLQLGARPPESPATVSTVFLPSSINQKPKMKKLLLKYSIIPIIWLAAFTTFFIGAGLFARAAYLLTRLGWRTL